MTAAITALMVSPGRKTNALTSPAQIDVFVINAMVEAPIRFTNNTPNIKLTANSFQVWSFGQIFSEYQPMRPAAIGQLNMYPADGPTSTASPPRPPVSTGRPMAIRMMKMTRLSVPIRFPKKQPASMTPSVWAVIGTGIKPRGNGGIIPNTAMRAANNAA